MAGAELKGGTVSGGKQFIAGIDDTGIPAPVITKRGEAIPGNYPFAGLGAVLISLEAHDELKGRWSHLRKGIQKHLRTPVPPAIHLRLMWGKRPDPKKGMNPYVGVDFAALRRWLTEARRILVSLLRLEHDMGLYVEFIVRANLTKDLAAYINDPKFADELAFLKRSSRYGGLGQAYEVYHTLTTSPLLRTLPVMLWRLDKDASASESSVRILIDRFSGTDSIDEEAVLRACIEQAGLGAINAIHRVEYERSCLCQAADFFGYAYNRMLLMDHGHIERDARFLEIAVPLIEAARSLDRWPAADPFTIPPETYRLTLCVIYALARHRLQLRLPDVVDRNLITVEEFRERVSSQVVASATGVSILKAGVL